MQSVEAESELVRELVRSGDYNPGTVQVVPLLRSIMPQEDRSLVYYEITTSSYMVSPYNY